MIKHMSYLDIPPDARKEAGLRRLSQLQRTLSDRSLPPSHRALVDEEVRRVSAWMNGSIAPSLPETVEVQDDGPVTEPKVFAQPQAFVVSVAETVSVDDR